MLVTDPQSFAAGGQDLHGRRLREDGFDEIGCRVEDMLEEASLTLQRLDIGKAMDDAKLQLQAQLLKDALHGMLSHELRSPLAAIQGSASVLGSAHQVRTDRRLHSLTEVIADEVQRLDGFIQNLVNTARVTTNSVQPRPEWTDPKDIVAAAIGARSRMTLTCLLHTDLRSVFSTFLPTRRSGWETQSCAIG